MNGNWHPYFISQLSVLEYSWMLFIWVSQKKHARASILLFSHSVVSDSLQPHGLQHAWLPCPSPSPGACSNSLPLSQWYHPTISSSVISFSSCLQSFPASESFLMSQLFASGGQNIGASASASVLSVNILDWFPSGLTGLISLQSKGLSRVFSNTTVVRTMIFQGKHRSLITNKYLLKDLLHANDSESLRLVFQ